jgi:hypothetical protein
MSAMEVGHARRLAGAHLPHDLEDLDRLVHERRQPGVAVVEAHDPEAPVGEHLAHLAVPGDHLRTQAHDQQQGGIVGAAERLVAEGDLPEVGEGSGHSGHRVR